MKSLKDEDMGEKNNLMNKNMLNTLPEMNQYNSLPYSL